MLIFISLFVVYLAQIKQYLMSIQHYTILQETDRKVLNDIDSPILSTVEEKLC